MDITNPRHAVYLGLVADGLSGEKAAEYLEAWDREASRLRVRPGRDYWRKGLAWINEQRAGKRQVSRR